MDEESCDNDEKDGKYVKKLYPEPPQHYPESDHEAKGGEAQVFCSIKVVPRIRKALSAPSVTTIPPFDDTTDAKDFPSVTTILPFDDTTDAKDFPSVTTIPPLGDTTDAKDFDPTPPVPNNSVSTCLIKTKI